MEASLIISFCALLVSAFTAYLTLFRRGTVKATKPSVIYFGPDGGRAEGLLPDKPKVFLRFLLFSTGKRGQIVETMFVTLRRGETRQTFGVWVYGDDKLARGSGLFVGESGIVCNHHFLLPRDGTSYSFLAGTYRVDVYASLVGSSATLHLISAELNVSESISSQLQQNPCGVYFDWGPDSGRYHAHLGN